VKDFGGTEPNSWNGLENLLNSPCKMTNHIRVFSEIDAHELAHDVERGELTNENSVEKELEEKEKIDTDGEFIESASNSKENVKVSRELKVLLEEDQVSNGEYTNGECNKHTLSNKVKIQKEAKSTEATSSLEGHNTLEKNMKDSMGQEDEKHVWEISSASEKLAECQETIVSIGQQLKLLASPKDAPVFDKLDTPVSNEVIIPEKRIPKQAVVCRNLEAKFNAAESSHKPVDTPHKMQLGTLALVPKRQPEGTNLLRKLLMRRKRESFKKLAMPVGA
jgi:hypothetical protein